METINDILYFIKKSKFTEYLEEDDYEKLDCVRNILVDEFQDVILVKLINILGITDDLQLFLTGEHNQIFSTTETLRKDNFQLIKEKMKGE